MQGSLGKKALQKKRQTKVRDGLAGSFTFKTMSFRSHGIERNIFDFQMARIRGALAGVLETVFRCLSLRKQL